MISYAFPCVLHNSSISMKSRLAGHSAIEYDAEESLESKQQEASEEEEVGLDYNTYEQQKEEKKEKEEERT